MDERTLRGLWEANAGPWTALARAGYDVYRDRLNTPAFIDALPPIGGSRGLDLGCGEGHNTRLLAAAAARMVGVDLSGAFVRAARTIEDADPIGIRYLHASAGDLPFHDRRFAFATAFMSLMDMADLERTLAEVFRVLQPGGFLQCSIEHPCYAVPHRQNLRDSGGRTYAIEVGEYFRPLRGEIAEWSFGAAPAEVRARYPKFRVPRFTRTLSEWLNTLMAAGFRLEYVGEPFPDDATVAAHAALQDAQVVAYFLHLRLRKPGD